MVCSKHFVDKRPTLKNSNPTLDLGYDKPAKISRRELVKSIPKVPVISKTFSDAVTWTAANNEIFTAASDTAANAEYHDCSSSTISSKHCDKCKEMGSLSQVFFTKHTQSF